MGWLTGVMDWIKGTPPNGAAQWGLLGLNVSRVTDQIYVGGEIQERDWQVLNQHNITVVVNLQAEKEDRFNGAHIDGYLWLPVTDHTPPTLKQLTMATRFIGGAVEAGKRVFIHCKVGVGRSPMVCAAYLVTQGMGVEEALAHVKEARDVVMLNELQAERLCEFAELLNAEGGQE